MSHDVSDASLALMRGMPSERVCVLVVGDQGVGKTSLVRCLCAEGEAQPLGPTGPTEGAHVQVKLVSGASKATQHFVELWELGGSPKYAPERPMFYKEVDFHGVIVVHDLTNRRSFENLKDIWIPEVVQGYVNGGSASPRRRSRGTALPDTALERRGAAAKPAAGGQGHGAEPVLEWHQALSTCPGLPLLVIGTKSELAPGSGNAASDAQQLSPLPCARASAALGQLEPAPLQAFFEAVLDAALGGSGSGGQRRARMAAGGGAELFLDGGV